MNLLMVTAGLPRPIGGANTRNFHLLKALSKIHRVSLLVLTNETEMNEVEVISELHECAEVVHLIPYELPGRSKRFIQLLNALRGKSYFLNLFVIPEMQQALDTICSLRHFDLAIFESVLVAGYKLPTGTKTVIDQHNIEYELLERTYKHEQAPIRKWYSWRESRLLKQGEIERCQKADIVLVTSERERTILNSLLSRKQIEVIPNGVDIDTFVRHTASQEVSHRIIFTGTMDYFPNINAVLFFARKCWPLIQEYIPDVTWQIVGKNPPAEIKALAESPGITVTGTVPEVHPFLAASSVVIAPLQVGSGTRLKILEALAMNRAVVSTSLGCEGLAIEDGKHLIVADRPEHLALAVIKLLNNQSMRSALGNAGRVLVETKYSWTHIGTQLVRALESHWSERERVC